MKQNTSYTYSTFISPFTWRYGSEEMRRIFSEEHKFHIWRSIWVALAKAQHKAGMVSLEELEDLVKHQENIDIERILEIEKETKHDVVAAIKEYAEKAKIGGGKIHMGATSMDIVDNADMVRAREALNLIEDKLRKIILLLCSKVLKYADVPCIGFTHLQPAEPTTVGYRFAFYLQDTFNNLKFLHFVKTNIKGKGFKGAVGTGASYTKLLQGSKITFGEMEKIIMEELGLESALITSQVYPRQYDYLLLTLLSSIAASLSKFAGDLRILQSPMFGEWSEPFGSKQVGSSAMPFKKNPINAEKICSLTRYIAGLPAIALENSALSYLERTLDDSANRRLIMADSFLALDEVLITAEKIIEGMVIFEEKIKFNLELYAPFAVTEVVMIEAVKKGANRQQIHEIIRGLSMESWQEINIGQKNSLKEKLLKNKDIAKFIPSNTLEKLFDIRKHVGNAPYRSLQLVKEVKKYLKVSQL